MPTNVPPNFNYAKFFGIESVAASVIFVALYIGLLVRFIRQSIRIPTYVHFVLVFFCVMRITAFVTRTVLASSDGAGQNLRLLVANQVFFNVGFFGLLYSAYTLVLDREIIYGVPTKFSIIFRITHDRRIFRFLLLTAVILGTVGLSRSLAPHASQSELNAANALRKAGIILFLILTVVQAFQTGVLASVEHRYQAKLNDKSKEEPWGMCHATHILCVVSILLIVREAFFTATIGNIKQAGNEHLWYPLAALSELLCVILYAAPGLIPPRSDLHERQTDDKEMETVNA